MVHTYGKWPPRQNNIWHETKLWREHEQMTKTPIYAAPDVSLIQLGYALVLPMTICLAKHEFTLKAPTSYLYTAYAPVVLPFSHQPPSSLPLDNFFWFAPSNV